MMLFEPNRTEFDLNWRMFGIPIRVHPMFWLISAAMGWSAIHLGLEYVAVWVACVFVSVLIHEMGHVFMGRIFGSDGHIVLYGFGGLAIGSNSLANPWQRMAVSFAGPLAGFLYLGVLIVGLLLFAPDQFDILVEKLKLMLGLPVRLELLVHKPTLAEAIVADLVWINLFWGLINLLPIWPLDGGQISKDFASWANPRNGERIALGISFILAALIAIHGLMIRLGKPLIPFLTSFDGTFLAIMFGLLALNSFMALQQLNQRPWREDWPSRWDQDRHRDDRRRRE